MNVNEILKETIAMVEALGIEVGDIEPNVKINTRAKSIWGRCSYKGVTKKYTIEVISDLLESEVGLRNTIMHEVLHACKGGMTHKGEWKRYAQMVNEKYNMDVKRTSTSEDKGLKEIEVEPKYKYVLQCQSCKHEYKRDRMSKFVKNPEKGKCGYCGGDIKRIL